MTSIIVVFRREGSLDGWETPVAKQAPRRQPLAATPVDRHLIDGAFLRDDQRVRKL
jgi:hypothetical protein